MANAAWYRMREALFRVDPVVLAGCIAVLAFVTSVATMSFEFGSRIGGWSYPYYRAVPWSAIVPFAAAAGCAVPLLVWSARWIDRREVLCIALWLIIGTGLVLLLRVPYPADFDAIIHSNKANSYYSVSLRPGFLALLQDFESVAPTLPLHARGNMPGKTGLFTLLGLLTGSREIMGVLILMLSNVCGLLCYWIARELGTDRRTALFALVLATLIPGKLAFVPLLNVIAPAFILLGFCFLLRFLRTGESWLALFLGADVYATAFFDPFQLTMAPLFALFIAVGLWQGRLSVTAFVRLLGYSTLSFAVVYAVVHFAFGFAMYPALLYIYEDARHFVAGSNRPYGVWLSENLIQFSVSLGVCNAVVWIGDIARTIGSAGANAASLRDRFVAPMALLSLGCIVVLLAIDISGTIRGEVARLFIYIACFIQIPVAAICARSTNVYGMAIVLVCTLLQGAVTVSMIAFVYP
jgi:hypothetical protein